LITSRSGDKVYVALEYSNFFDGQGFRLRTKLSLPLLERGVTYYNFTSNQFSGFHGIVIPGTLHDLRGKKPLNSAVRLLEGSR
jgi:hypothetical protein